MSASASIGCYGEVSDLIEKVSIMVWLLLGVSIELVAINLLKLLDGR